ncbi:MAG: hypothetical protein QME06_06400 [Desulfobacterales bacterium]|nr:hypothetical protein [Desulfobacterales bacterium]
MSRPTVWPGGGTRKLNTKNVEGEIGWSGINNPASSYIMNSYHKEQSDAIYMVRHFLANISLKERQRLESDIADYLKFREEAALFLSAHFSEVCTQKCYQSRLSACCSREGIITFFADVVVNALMSQDGEIDFLLGVLKKPDNGLKCIYLGGKGCLWRLKPIVCEMFLCEHAKKEVFSKNQQLEHKWGKLKQREKLYTWPDSRVVFDALESYFIEAGYSSPLMYMHNSPGLLRVKRRALSCAASCKGGD